MTEPNAPENTGNDLVGVRGWLLFYVVGTILIILGLLSNPTIWSGSASPVGRYFTGLIMTIEVIGVYLIFRVPKPITRNFHIWLRFISAGFSAFFTMESGEPEGLVAVLISLAWASYWIVSKRVRATYCQNTGQDD